MLKLPLPSCVETNAQPATDSNVPSALTGVNILDETSDTNVMVLRVLNRPGGPLTSFHPIFGRSQTDKLTATYRNDTRTRSGWLRWNRPRVTRKNYTPRKRPASVWYQLCAFYGKKRKEEKSEIIGRKRERNSFSFATSFSVRWNKSTKPKVVCRIFSHFYVERVYSLRLKGNVGGQEACNEVKRDA